jgi:hypothetical protein
MAAFSFSMFVEHFVGHESFKIEGEDNHLALGAIH